MLEKLVFLCQKFESGTFVYRMTCTSIKFGASQYFQLAYARADMVKSKKSQLAQSLGNSHPLEIQSLWPIK